MTKYLTINKLTEILSRCYEAKTAYPSVQSEWNENNKTLGQCAVTALIVQYYFGGELYKHNKYIANFCAEHCVRGKYEEKID